MNASMLECALVLRMIFLVAFSEDVSKAIYPENKAPLGVTSPIAGIGMGLAPWSSKCKRQPVLVSDSERVLRITG